MGDDNAGQELHRPAALREFPPHHWTKACPAAEQEHWEG